MEQEQVMPASWDIVKRINTLIDKYIYHLHENTRRTINPQYCHHLDPDTIPLQGWKLHVSVRDLEDYEQVLNKLLPKLEANRIQYKVTNPQFLNQQLHSNQIGKAITIYPTPGCDLSKVFPQTALSSTHRLMQQYAPEPLAEEHISGRIYARYGTLRGLDKKLLNPEGFFISETRHQESAPRFITVKPTLEGITEFYSEAALRYGRTRNHKDYVEEMMLGTHTWECEHTPDWDSRRHNFMIIQFPHESYDAIKSVVESQRDGFSCMFKMHGAEYGIIHNNDAQKIFQKLTEQNIPYHRPDWDIAYNISVIEPGSEQKVLQALSDMCENKPIYNGTPQMQIFKLPNGMTAVQYETNQDKDFTEICQWKQAKVYDMVLGKNINQIQQNWQQVVDHTMYALSQQTQNLAYQQSQTQDMHDFTHNTFERELK